MSPVRNKPLAWILVAVSLVLCGCTKYIKKTVVYKDHVYSIWYDKEDDQTPIWISEYNPDGTPTGRTIMKDLQEPLIKEGSLTDTVVLSSGAADAQGAGSGAERTAAMNVRRRL